MPLCPSTVVQKAPVSQDTGAFCYCSHQLIKPLKEPEQRIAAHGQRTDAYTLHGAACTVYVVRRDIFLPHKGKDFRANGLSLKMRNQFFYYILFGEQTMIFLNRREKQFRS